MRCHGKNIKKKEFYLFIYMSVEERNSSGEVKNSECSTLCTNLKANLGVNRYLTFVFVLAGTNFYGSSGTFPHPSVDYFGRDMAEIMAIANDPVPLMAPGLFISYLLLRIFTEG